MSKDYKSGNKPYSREEFRNKVFKRDNYKCVICGKEAVDAHHILERRLWDNGGYILNNGASLCSSCHIKAEQTLISCDEIREAAGITKVVLPDHLYSDELYDKWGNILLTHNRRILGELFSDESVQKILRLGGVLSLFSKYIKYPRTYHLPWSPGITSDDRVLKDISNFENKSVVVTEKMDGENTTMYHDYLHARSIDMDSHTSRDWIKNYWSNIKHEIPSGWRFCGENLYSKHSIKYTGIPSYFMLFGIWNDKNICLSWNETKEWARLLDIQLVPEIYETNLFTEEKCKFIWNQWNSELKEGYVVRLQDSFQYGSFRKSVAKYVREGHVQTSHNWKYQRIEKNELIKG